MTDELIKDLTVGRWYYYQTETEYRMVKILERDMFSYIILDEGHKREINRFESFNCYKNPNQELWEKYILHKAKEGI